MIDPTTGWPYQNLPCSVNPEMWDDDAPRAYRAMAAQRCLTQCPALDPCRTRHRGKTAGVIAGVA